MIAMEATRPRQLSVAPLPDGLAPRHERMARRLRYFHNRGMNARELREECGDRWRRTLAELRELGFVIEERASKFSRKTYRWVLVAEPDPDAATTADQEEVLDEDLWPF